MNERYKKAYVEVLEILNNMDSKYIEKIPKKLIEFLYNKICPLPQKKRDNYNVFLTAK